MLLRWYGTASLSLTTGGSSLLFDPFVPMRGSKVRTTAADYDGFGTVVITHAHLDHIASLPELAKRLPRVVYGTKAVRDALEKRQTNASVRVVAPGERFDAGDFSLTVYRGKHIRFDAKLVAKTLISPRMLRHARNLGALGSLNKLCRENGETVAYLVEAEGKKLFVMGSLGLDPDTVYPEGMDALILPYQGASDLLTPARAVIERLKPKAVFLDHWDDAFPPLSRTVDADDAVSKLADLAPVRKLDRHSLTL